MNNKDNNPRRELSYNEAKALLAQMYANKSPDNNQVGQQNNNVEMSKEFVNNNDNDNNNNN